MKKIASLLFLTVCTCYAFAYCLYVDPNATVEGYFAESWDDAVTPAYFSRSSGNLQDGDTILIKGGIYRLKALNEKWVISKDVTIIGGFNPSLTGTDKTMPTYPSETPTIFDGDINNDGVPNKGDAPSLLRIEFQGKELGKGQITIQGIIFRNTYNDNVEEATKDLQTYLADCSALRLICGKAFVKNCEFYNHRSPINRGSQCVTSVGCNLHMMDCSLHDCTCMSRGALIRLRSYFIGGVESNPLNGDCVLERCALYNANNMGGEAMNASGEYGGAVHASTGRMFAINSTFACDTSYSKGGAIRPNAAGLWLISCTFVNNIAVRCYSTTDAKPNTYGSALGMDGNTQFAVANTIILDDIDTYSKRYSPVYSDDNDETIQQFSDLCTTGGNNLLGTFWLIANSALLDQSDFWTASDRPTLSKTAVNKYSTYFGTIKDNFKDNGGFSKTIFPLEMQNGDNVAHLQELADEWCPEWTSVDASKDQRGYIRDANITCIGAAALEGEKPSALGRVAADHWNGTCFNVLGQPVDETYRGIVIKNGKKVMIQ